MPSRSSGGGQPGSGVGCTDGRVGNDAVRIIGSEIDTASYSPTHELDTDSITVAIASTGLFAMSSGTVACLVEIG